MASIFDVTPEELKNSATSIQAKTEAFTRAYENIYNAVSDLQVKYQGEASTTFNQRIEGYRNDFVAAEKALTNYVAFLNEYANNLNSTENNIKGLAQNLSTGN